MTLRARFGPCFLVSLGNGDGSTERNEILSRFNLAIDIATISCVCVSTVLSRLPRLSSNRARTSRDHRHAITLRVDAPLSFLRSPARRNSVVMAPTVSAAWNGDGGPSRGHPFPSAGQEGASTVARSLKLFSHNRKARGSADGSPLAARRVASFSPSSGSPSGSTRRMG